MVERKTIGHFFREQREISGHSREFIARCLGTLSVDDLSAFEDGSGSICADELYELTNFLNVDPEQVLRRLQASAVLALEADVARRIQEGEDERSLEGSYHPVKITGTGGTT